MSENMKASTFTDANGNAVEVVDAQAREYIDELSKGISGTKNTEAFDAFMHNVDVDYSRDADTGAYYTVTRVYRDRLDGGKQFPFVLRSDRKTAYELSHQDGWYLAINAGIFINSFTPDGMLIQNGEVLQNTPTTSHPNCKALTIDHDGMLGFAAADADANELVSNGIISAVSGFMPIIVDYAPVPSSEWNAVDHYTQNTQRQIIGQWGCGDYAIVTCEGRSNHNSDGWTIAEAQNICVKLGLKFAYNLDGGGSTETMLGLKHINTIYDNTTGRYVPTFIVFNGKDYFEKPDTEDKPDSDNKEYTVLNYITLTGKQYIDTGVAESRTIGAETIFSIPEFTSGGKHVLSAKNTYLSVIVSGSRLVFKRCGSNESMLDSLTINTNTVHTVRAFVDDNSVILDEAQLFDNVDVGDIISGNFCVGAYGGGVDSNSYRFIGNIYGIKMYDDGEIIRDFVPVINPDGEIGLLDTVQNKFYASETDVPFVAGTVKS